jgi:hypothetical protein
MLLSKRRLDRAVVIGFACFLSVVFGCPAPSTAPEQYALELADRGTLVVDVERVDSWKKSYRSTFTYLPPLGAGGPEPVAEVPGQYLPQSLIGVEQEQLDLMPTLRQIGEGFEREPDGRVAIDDIRIVELQVCPANGPPDRLRVLFGIRRDTPSDDDGARAPQGVGYRSQPWRLRRSEEVWRVDAVELNDPTAAAILELNRATYDEVRSCRKVY